MKEWQHHRGSIIDSVKDFDVIECDSCGFKHIVPIPSPDELINIYKDEYYSKEKPLYIEQYTEDLEWWNLVYSKRYDVFESQLSSDRRSILDIGSGPGYFLLHGKNRGWTVKGIEPSSKAAEHSRTLGLDIINSCLSEETASELGCYDVVNLSEVLEHIPEPGKFLPIVTRLLKPGGILLVMVPNEYNPLQSAIRNVLQKNPWWVAPPHHLNYFDIDSLKKLIEKSGCLVFDYETTFPMEMFILMGDDYVGNDVLGRKCHGKRKTFESSLAKAGMSEWNRDFYKCFAKAGVGRDIVMYAKKSSLSGSDHLSTI